MDQTFIIYVLNSIFYRCCNTCEEVREAYRKKGWAFNNAENIAQCEREGWSEKMRVQQNEGCDVYGYLEVNKVAGNFHFAPGKSFQQQHVHGNFIEKCLHIMFVSFNCLTRWVLLVEQEPHAVSVHLSVPLIFCGVHASESLVFCVVFCGSLFVHLSVLLLLNIVLSVLLLLNIVLSDLLLLNIVLSVLLRYTSSDYPFGIFKLFLHCRG